MTASKSSNIETSTTFLMRETNEPKNVELQDANAHQTDEYLYCTLFLPRTGALKCLTAQRMTAERETS
jgi:hypothetical protein